VPLIPAIQVDFVGRVQPIITDQLFSEKSILRELERYK